MLSLEEYRLGEKYMNEYTEYCKQTECGETCPVYQAHEKDKSKSCFMHYCHLREAGKLNSPTA